jgi:hypothetical protein
MGNLDILPLAEALPLPRWTTRPACRIARFERVLGLRIMSHTGICRAGRGRAGVGSRACGVVTASVLLRAVVQCMSSGTLLSEAMDEWPLSLLGAVGRMPLSYEAQELDFWWPELPVRVEALSLMLPTEVLRCIISGPNIGFESSLPGTSCSWLL